MTHFDHEMFEQAVAAEKRHQRRTRIFCAVVAIGGLTPLAWVVAGFALGYEGRTRLITAPALAAVSVALAYTVIVGIQSIVSRVFMSFLQPGGQSRGAKGHSKAEALAAAGLLEEASAEFAQIRDRQGNGVAVLRAEAELHATASGDPRRAEQLFQSIRRAPDATLNDELYASHRLIDLYLGALDDDGRVMVELRRMAERFPNTPDGQGALAELKRRRAQAA